MTEDIRSLVVAYEDKYGEECLYVNGKKRSASGRVCIDSIDIQKAVGNKPIRLERLPVVSPQRGKPWPRRLEDLEIAPSEGD